MRPHRDVDTGQADKVETGRYAALVENSPYCIHEIDSGGGLVSMNPAGLRMMGVAQECELVGTAYLDAVGAADRPRIERLMLAAFDGEASEFEFTAVNGRLFRSNFVPLRDAGGAVERLMGITQDVTEQREMQRRLTQASQLDAIGRLAGGVAHDFNTLLTVIMASAEKLGRRGSAAQCAEVASISAAAQRGAELTAQLLSFARKSIVRPRKIDVGAQIEAIERLLRRLLTENIALSVVVPTRPMVVEIDPGQFDRVLVNLAANARDAMPRGGALTIELSRVELDRDAAAVLTGSRPGPHARVTVSDTGPGIDAETLSHVFEPFYSTKNLAEGVGLGLATCHGIISQAGGVITARSDPGHGTAFEIHLPLCDAPVDAIAEPIEPRPVTGTVLLVEDDPLVREAATLTLADAGLDVVEASSGEAALALPSEQLQRAELLITDVVLPGINGRELAERLRGRDGPRAVLFVSGYPDDTVLAHGVRDDVVCFLPKPYLPGMLQRTVADVLRQVREKRLPT